VKNPGWPVVGFGFAMFHCTPCRRARGVLVRIVIAGGGTGGHLFPALAVHEVLRARRPEACVLFVGAAHGVEAEMLPRRGYAFRGLASAPVSGRGLRGRLTAARGLPGTVRQARRILREFRPQVVLGMGGYASVPTMLAAVLCRTPRVIHEQNAVPGLANRWLGRMAHLVAVSFADSARFFPVGSTEVTGNPVRAEIRAGDAGAARERLGLARDAFTVLVVGGSQGAHRLNQAVREALPDLAAEGAGLQFVHATGARDLPEVRHAYEAAGVRGLVEPFIELMAPAYQAADFVVCRAGAGTVFELAAVGKPALLVPYPHAANDHQRLNAEAAVHAGAAWVLADQFCDGRRLAASVRAAREKPAQLVDMGRKARALARPDAADRLVDLVERAARMD
jgi:UDP-N-acetylglucosamine--N-acetylmuramyl-(pentapeptide) pyrophosphoryl-undecaprenol N-acetylglucosamine transferase